MVLAPSTDLLVRRAIECDAAGIHGHLDNFNNFRPPPADYIMLDYQDYLTSQQTLGSDNIGVDKLFADGDDQRYLDYDYDGGAEDADDNEDSAGSGDDSDDADHCNTPALPI